MNDFIKANTYDPRLTNTYTENGALSYLTFGSEIMNQFGKAGSYRGRDITDVWNDQSQLWAQDAKMGLMFPFYLRLITRNVDGIESEKVQRGQGARDESFKRFLFIAKYHPTEFYENLWLIPIFGSWKDLWELMAMDYDDDYLDTWKFFEVINSGLNSTSTCELVKKYMPQIRSTKKCVTDRAVALNQLAKEFAYYNGLTAKEYREVKSTGKAHKFQQLICGQRYDEINWSHIPGKALLNLANGKFLSNHGLTDSYIKWLDNQPTVKFNGYPFELGRKLKYETSRASIMTIDRQFASLIETGKKDGGSINGNVLCALDTSGSMSSAIDDYGTTSYDVCVSLGIYFSELNTGEFHNVVAMFDDTSSLLTLNGTFSEKLRQIHNARTAWGSTNFQSLIDLIVKTRRTRPDIAIEDFPQTLLVVSDMQFNPTNHSWGRLCTNDEIETNYEMAMRKLKEVFPEEFVDNFKIIWWQCANRRTDDFPSNMECGGTYVVSGFDGAVVSFILGGEDNEQNIKVRQTKTMEDIINEVFSQDIFKYIKF